jgi:hypothetical protein
VDVLEFEAMRSAAICLGEHILKERTTLSFDKEYKRAKHTGTKTCRTRKPVASNFKRSRPAH